MKRIYLLPLLALSFLLNAYPVEAAPDEGEADLMDIVDVASEVTINTSAYQPGIYSLILYDGTNQVSAQQFIIQH